MPLPSISLLAECFPCVLFRLDLDKWINDPPESSEEEGDDEDIESMFFETEK
jgi:hypothetical protein